MAKVLFIVSGATYWVLKDGTRYATGYWAEEFANPYKIVTDAGHEVVVATPNGVTPNVDMMSLRPEMAGGEQGALELEAIIRSAEVMRRPLKLSDVRLEDYDAVYLPGGHGPMADLAFDADVGRLLTAQLASGKPLFIVCHGPAAMLATRIHGVSPFKGYRVTCFTNEEEEAVGLASRATWLLETELKEKVGVDFSRGEMWKPYMVEDRNLVTGQNPALGRGPGKTAARGPADRANKRPFPVRFNASVDRCSPADGTVGDDRRLRNQSTRRSACAAFFPATRTSSESFVPTKARESVRLPTISPRRPSARTRRSGFFPAGRR